MNIVLRNIEIVSVGVGVHQSMEAAEILERRGISCDVIDLRTVYPLDEETVCNSVKKTGRLLVVDEDYGQFGLSGELSALVLEKGISIQYQRIATMETIPYSRLLEDSVLPGVEEIVEKAIQLMK